MTQHDPTPAIEVWARMLCAADVHVYGADHPTWQQLVGEPGRRIRDDYRKAAAWLLPRMTAAPPPADQADLRNLIAEKLHVQMPGCTHDEHGSDCLSLADAVLAVLPTTDRAAWASAADHLAGIWQESVRTLAEDARRPGLLAAIEELRRMADEAQPAQAASEAAKLPPMDPVHILGIAAGAPHACRNCEGIDPDTCLKNSDRTAQS
jgi:hypothetical protein